jgi:hypothetical protein
MIESIKLTKDKTALTKDNLNDQVCTIKHQRYVFKTLKSKSI